MNDIRSLTPLIQKRTEGVQVYRLEMLQDGDRALPDSSYHYQITFATADSLVKVVDAKTSDSFVEFDSNQLTDLPAGVYRMELWEMHDDVIHAIYPSDRQKHFIVEYNTKDLPTGKVSSMTLDVFEKRFDKLANSIKTGTVEAPRFKVGETTTVATDQPASVEMVINDDGTITFNYRIPRGRDGDTWEPYISEDDGHWHLKLKTKQDDND